jgi:hypothetical protein
LALSFSAAYAIALLASLRPAPPRHPFLIVRAAVERVGYGELLVKFSGNAALPDGAPLTLQLTRFTEQNRDGRLESISVDAGTVESVVWGGAFTCERRLPFAGVYRVQVFRPPHRWQVHLQIWDETELGRALKEFDQVETLIRDLSDLNARMDVTTASELDWRAHSEGLLLEVGKLYSLIEAIPQHRTHYPAALKDLGLLAHLLSDATIYFFWNTNGQFGGAFDPHRERWVKTPDGQTFGFDHLRSLLASVLEVARREHALWILNEARRTDRRNGAARGMSALLNGFENGAPLDVLEERVRGIARPPQPPPEPPLPGRFGDLIARRNKLEEATRLLGEADRLWDELADRDAPALYGRLLREYPEQLDRLQARTRANNRARE